MKCFEGDVLRIIEVQKDGTNVTKLYVCDACFDLNDWVKDGKISKDLSVQLIKKKLVYPLKVSTLTQEGDNVRVSKERTHIL